MSNSIRIKVWGRDFDLNVKYMNYPGEDITEVQNNTFNNIVNVSFDDALSPVKEYILKHDSDNFDSDSIDNIFKYVMPKKIAIDRTTDGKRTFAVLCDYKFDMEHGLAIVYENELFKKVGPQDIFL